MNKKVINVDFNTWNNHEIEEVKSRLAWLIVDTMAKKRLSSMKLYKKLKNLGFENYPIVSILKGKHHGNIPLEYYIICLSLLGVDMYLDFHQEDPERNFLDKNIISRKRLRGWRETRWENRVN